MTGNEKRREGRYQRRKAARIAKRKERLKDALDFDKVFTFAHLYRSALLCFRGVRWKASVQSYRARCGINVARRLRALRNGIFKLRKCPEFTIRERGHARRINSIHIDDRVPQKCICKYSLKPVLHPTLLYDNYASQEKKGTTKARQRLKCRLEKHIRKHGMTGGMIIFDFRHFFDSIRHSLVRFVLERYYDDQRLIGMNMRIVKQCREHIGLILGSENSQDFAIATPNIFDHYVAQALGIDSYGRYMDDGCIIDKSYEKVKSIYGKLKDFAARFGFTLNEKKTRLLHFGQQFTFLQRKYDFTESGHIIVRPARKSVVRERRKLKRLHNKLVQGTIPFETCRNSAEAWRASIKGTRCQKISKSINKLFDRLFIEEWLEGKEDAACITKSYQKGRSSMLATA